MAKLTKKDFLKKTIEHIDMKKYNVVPMVEAFEHMAYASREVARASKIYNMMLADKKCSVILCIAGSLVSAGMKKSSGRHDPKPHGRCYRFQWCQHCRPRLF